jgi:glycosyltransferase involved in cell wall biosynthesis
MNRQKILHIITKGSPFGGAQKYVFELATHLPKDDFESVVVVGRGDELPDKLKNESRSTDHEVRVTRIDELGRDIDVQSEFLVFWKLVKIIREEKPSIVHLNSSKIGGLGALAVRTVNFLNLFQKANKLPATKAIFTAHGWAFNEIRPKYSLLTIKFLSWITMILAHTTITVARNEEVQAMNMPFVRHKIKLIYNGIEPIDFKDQNTAREFLMNTIKYPISPDTLWIGTIAELHRNKNLAMAISALSDIQEKIVCLIIGAGEERANLERLITEKNLQNKVFLVGKIEHASTYLKAFDIFILPSVKEGLPYTILEAGLAELPTLSTYVGGIPEIMRNNISGILVDPKVEKIRTGLEFLIENPKKAHEFGKTLKQKIQKDFSLDRMIEETVKVYRQ